MERSAALSFGRAARFFVAAIALCLVSTTAWGSTQLGRRVEKILRDYGFPQKSIGLEFLDEKGRSLVAINAESPRKPASNLKVLTTAAALSILGAEYQFETRLLASMAPEAGVIRGDLILRGTGDPNISGRFYNDDPTRLIEDWAAGLVQKLGLRHVTGSVVADDSFFDDVRFLPTWDPAQAGRWYSAQVSPLSFNDNCVDVRIEPATRVGAAAHVRILPQSRYFSIHGNLRTVAGRKRKVQIHRRPGTNVIRLSGEIGYRGNKNFYDHVTVDDPSLFLATVVKEALERRGVRIDGAVKRVAPEEYYYDEKTRRKGDGVKAKESVLVYHRSTLAQDLPVINKPSQNLHAEMLLKTLGARVFGRGTTEDGAAAVRKFLKDKRIPAPGIQLHDGSGLSHENRIAASTLVRTLHSARGEPYFKRFYDSLAVAGVDGTLKKRFRRQRRLHGQVHAKTGAIRGVSALSGFVRRGPLVWSFSILVGAGSPKSKSPRELQEALVAAMFEAMPTVAP